MKKNVVIAIIVVLVLIISAGCQKQTGYQGGYPTFNSYADYKRFLQDNGLEDKIVTYDEIKSIGLFEVFVDMSGDRVYQYRLIDTTGNKVTVYIRAIEFEENTLYPIIWEHLETDVIENYEDMRRINVEHTGSVEVNGIGYEYILGKLYSVSWTDNGLIYSVRTETVNADGNTTRTSSIYDISASTFFAKLLNTNIAEAAVYELMQIVNQ